MNRCSDPFRGAWRGAGLSGFLGLSRVCGSTNESDKTDPRPDRLPLNRPPLTQRSYKTAIVIRCTMKAWTRPLRKSIVPRFLYLIQAFITWPLAHCVHG